jgi:aryl-alcohol dehydrogenase-like predicted oxidoreductase
MEELWPSEIPNLVITKCLENMKNYNESRRVFIKTTATAAAGITLLPGFGFAAGRLPRPMRRTFGKLGFEVTSLGLGGQASIQWTPADVDPVKIILKAFRLGINYFDTSNLYGPSQLNYGTAFKNLSLIPVQAGYDEKLRRSIFLTTKTHLRFAKGGADTPGVNNWTNGAPDSHTVDDIKRSLSQLFGDGKGNYPEGAYLDMVLIHNLNTLEEVDALYEGLYDTDAKSERIGALAALRDYRDGTNLTGLNPEEEKLIRYIGFSGHYSAPVMMEMIQRDRGNLLDAMLVAMNANDRINFNMQHNVIPVATAKNMGVIAMKVFADGAMYTKAPNWTRNSDEVVRTVGSKALPSSPLIQYTLTTPGIHTAIIGIGQISDDPALCQLENNLKAAQVAPLGLTIDDRLEIEKMTNRVKDGKTNYFQLQHADLSAPANVSASQHKSGDERMVEVSWDSSYAGDEPVIVYEIWRDGKKTGVLNHTPQITKKPFMFLDKPDDLTAHEYVVVAVDAAGRSRGSGEVKVTEL